ncbi:hypothetical protein [Nonomuraea pusilla]|uniref:Excreted virulence factor EspC, type VII ESX diderm n=1 Tax=Nonomuraea pusilla TaxID=46177 RepID=A0A1H7HZK9_9ACTN|nr:hypothetical protein [Nonomuraea pusilla]SEK55057.1 hypothetical protein SAMN05660976_00623 [Nonomuraea pusilla]
MPARIPAIIAHAEVLRADARALAACAERLRAVEAGLKAGDGTPPWLRAAVTAHLAACVTAAADLESSARHLLRYAEKAGAGHAEDMGPAGTQRPGDEGSAGHDGGRESGPAVG